MLDLKYPAGECLDRWNTRADAPPTLEQAMQCPEVQALVSGAIHSKGFSDQLAAALATFTEGTDG
jgi:hypothetical protein